ncbi:MAG: carboxypeptidase regulatory-like domain-containing protein, partial [Gemmatimonadales bacterium]
MHSCTFTSRLRGVSSVFQRSAHALSIVVLCAFGLGTFPHAAFAARGPGANADLTGTVVDSGSRQPLPGVDVAVLQNGRVVSRTSTDPFGRFTLHDLPDGNFTIEIRAVGFRPLAQG